MAEKVNTPYSAPLDMFAMSSELGRPPPAPSRVTARYKPGLQNRHAEVRRIWTKGFLRRKKERFAPALLVSCVSIVLLYALSDYRGEDVEVDQAVALYAYDGLGALRARAHLSVR